MKTGRPERRSAVRVVAASITLDASAMLPLGILGAAAIQIRQSLGVDQAQIGYAVSSFFLAGAFTGIMVSGVIDRLGWQRATLLGSGFSAGSLLAAALLVDSGLGLLLALGIGGMSFAVVQPATNLMLASRIPFRKLGGVLGVKQSSVPVALMVAGALVPTAAAIYGWRTPFAFAPSVLILGLLLANPRRAAELRHRKSASPHLQSPQPSTLGNGLGPPSLLATGIGVAFASLMPGTLTSFVVIRLGEVGFSPGAAGAIFAGANIAGVLVRLGSGWIADRATGDAHLAVAAFMCIGGLSTALIGLSSPGLIMAAAIAAFTFGWGWSGLLFLTVVRAHPQARGRASAVASGSGMLGAGLGPAVATFVASITGWSLSWAVIGLGGIVGGGIIARQRPRNGA